MSPNEMEKSVSSNFPLEGGGQPISNVDDGISGGPASGLPGDSAAFQRRRDKHILVYEYTKVVMM
jgi:hypothetical protein